MISILEDIRKIASGKRQLREFGLTIGTVLMLLAGLALWKGKASCSYFFISGLFFIGFGVIRPAVLRPPQKAWMIFSVVIGFFMSRLILTILFYGVITPIAAALRLFRKDILDQRISKERSSYWHQRPVEAKTKESYENQY